MNPATRCVSIGLRRKSRKSQRDLALWLCREAVLFASSFARDTKRHVVLKLRGQRGHRLTACTDCTHSFTRADGDATRELIVIRFSPATPRPARLIPYSRKRAPGRTWDLTDAWHGTFRGHAGLLSLTLSRGHSSGDVVQP
eukprot:6659591-Prymnesium_polylepis.2